MYKMFKHNVAKSFDNLAISLSVLIPVSGLISMVLSKTVSFSVTFIP